MFGPGTDRLLLRRDRRFVLQVVAGLPDAARVDRFAALLDVLDLPVFIDQKRGANGQALVRIQDPVLHADFTFEVAEQWEGDAEVFGKAFVAGGGIDADADDLSVVCFIMCDISLICA